MSLGERPRGSARPTPNEHYNSLPRTSIEGALGTWMNKGINRARAYKDPGPSTTYHHILLLYRQRVASILPPTLLGCTQLSDWSGAGNPRCSPW